MTVTIDDRPHTVFVDASTGRVRGIVDDGHRIGVVANLVHGTLLMGAWGDRLIEIAASLGILLLVSGVYLWFPKGTPFWQAFRMTGGSRRLAWRDLHKTTGAILAPVLAFYLISGLAWTDVWGGQFVQAWSTLRATNAAPGESPAHTHETLNAGSSKVVPWNLEQTPVPSSPQHTGHGRITLDAAIAAAQREGIGQRFWVGVPSGVDGIWTIAQTGLNDDVNDPTQELTVHVDQHTGRRGRPRRLERLQPDGQSRGRGNPASHGFARMVEPRRHEFGVPVGHRAEPLLVLQRPPRGRLGPLAPGDHGDSCLGQRSSVWHSRVLVCLSGQRLELHVVEQLEVAPHLRSQILDERQVVSVQLIRRIVEARGDRVGGVACRRTCTPRTAGAAGIRRSAVSVEKTRSCFAAAVTSPPA